MSYHHFHIYNVWSHCDELVYILQTCTSPSEVATFSRVLFGAISSAVSLHVEVEGTFLLPFEIEGKFPLPFEVVGKFPLPFEIEGKFPLLVKGKVTPEVDGTLRVDALQEAVERPHQEVSPFYRADSSLSVLKFLDTPLIFVQYTIQETHWSKPYLFPQKKFVSVFYAIFNTIYNQNRQTLIVPFVNSTPFFRFCILCFLFTMIWNKK